MKEIWKNIKGYNGKYEISNLGNVASFSFKKNGALLKPNIRNGYYSVVLYHAGLPKSVCIHRLVGLFFIKNPKKKPQINHKDCNKLNNNYKNLEWCTQTENMEHAYNNSLIPILRGESNGSSKLVTLDIIKIRNLYPKLTMENISKIFKISIVTVWRIIHRKRWRHVR